MNIFKRVLGHLYFFYGILLFCITMLIAIIPTGISLLYNDPKRSRISYNAFRVWMGIYMPLVFCPVRRKGKEHFKKGENYVVVINHNSFVDIPVSSPWVPGPNKTLAKAELARTPLFGIIYRSGSILVDRKSEHSRKESFTRMQEALKKGLHLTLYPEGTRNKTDEPLQPFFDGAFITAIRAQKPIIPGIIFGTKKILPLKPKLWAWPHRIDFHFLEAIPTKGMSMSDRGALKDRVYNIMKEYIIAGSR